MSISTRRSSSFKVLPRDSPGDGEFLHHYTGNGTLASTATRENGRHHKRRNRQKNKKISIPLKLGFDISPDTNLRGDGRYTGQLRTDFMEDECYDGGRSSVSTPGEGIEYREEFPIVKDTERIPLVKEKEGFPGKEAEEEHLEKANEDAKLKQELFVKTREKLKLKEELLKASDDPVKANYELDKVKMEHLQPKDTLESKDTLAEATYEHVRSKDEFVKTGYNLVKSKDELVKSYVEIVAAKGDQLKTFELIDERKDENFKPIDEFFKPFGHDSEACSTNLQQKSIDLSSSMMVMSNEDMDSAVNGALELTNGESAVIQSQDTNVELAFVDPVVHNVARHPSFGDSDGFDFDITYKAHVSTGSEPVIASPFNYFVGEVLHSSFTSQDVQSVENDKKREHVYNTMFHVPWRCELLIFVGFFVCLDSFLTLLTIMPVRVCIFLWRLLCSRRKFRRLRADELADLGSLLVLVIGVTLLQQTDISYIYHMIRSQATIKLYVVYNVLEIFDKLCQSFGSDVLQVLLNSAENVATCSHHVLPSEVLRLILDQCIAVFSSVLHSFIILAQAITVSAAIRSHNNALLTLLISNNFAEIKSNVFKRLTKDNLHKLAYLDTVERFHIIAHLFFVLAQNLLAANEPWIYAFAGNAGIVFSCEVLVDVIKHAFLAKFNEIKPSAYSEFLLSLCEQTLSTQSHEVHKTMSFVPFAPACVVIRVLVPLYAAYLPGAPFWWFCCMLIYGVTTYCFLVAMKILVSFLLLKHASWYVARYKKKAKLYHID